MPLFEHFGLGEDERQRLDYTVITLENHIVFQKEVFAHEEITIKILIHDYDLKRIHAFMTLHETGGDQCATFEVMYMGIDRKTGRPAQFPAGIAETVEKYHDALENGIKSKEIGRKISIRR